MRLRWCAMTWPCTMTWLCHARIRARQGFPGPTENLWICNQNNENGTSSRHRTRPGQTWITSQHIKSHSGFIGPRQASSPRLSVMLASVPPSQCPVRSVCCSYDCIVVVAVHSSVTSAHDPDARSAVCTRTGLAPALDGTGCSLHSSLHSMSKACSGSCNGFMHRRVNTQVNTTTGDKLTNTHSCKGHAPDCASVDMCISLHQSILPFACKISHIHCIYICRCMCMPHQMLSHCTRPIVCRWYHLSYCAACAQMQE